MDFLRIGSSRPFGLALSKVPARQWTPTRFFDFFQFGFEMCCLGHFAKENYKENVARPNGIFFRICSSRPFGLALSKVPALLWSPRSF